MKIPLGKPMLGIEEKNALLQALDSGYLSSPQIVGAFEDALAGKFQRGYCVVVNSGTSALYLALKASGIRKVIIPSMTCINVLNAVLNAGAEPVFADIESETHNIDLSTLSGNQWDEADGLIVTHAYGHAADMDTVASYVREHNLSLIEDFAQATGGYYRGKILGSFGRVSITSFYDTKPMTTGHGGAILTDDSEVYQKCLYARGDKVNDYYSNIIPMNLKMSGIQAAVGLAQLKKLDSMVEMRRNVARQLTTLLSKLELKLPNEKPDVKPTYYKYHLVLPEYIQKQEFIKEMGREDISVGICCDPPLHKTRLAMNVLHTEISLPVAEKMAPRTVSLPIFPELNESDISRICHAVTSILENCKNPVS
jgi:perosamine synthetase